MDRHPLAQRPRSRHQPPTPPSQPQVRQPNNEYRETTLDLRLKVPGGTIDIARTWSQGRWWLNPAWGPLNFELDPLGQDIKLIARGGLLYERSGSSHLYIARAKSYAPLTIRKTDTNPHTGTAPGWQWSDRHGNTIDYDQNGRILGYADPHGTTVRFAYDSPTQIRILDHHNQPAYTLTLDDGLITHITDRAGRHITYTWQGSGQQRRLTQVTDVTGQPWTYTYNPDGQLTGRQDPLGQQGQKISITYANSVTAPAPQLTVGTSGITYDPTGTSGTTTKLKNAWGAARVSLLQTGTRTHTASTQYLREKRQFLVNETDPRGNSIQTLYDLDGFQIQRTLNGTTTGTRQWDGDYTSKVTNARGLTTTYHYNHNRDITHITHPDGSYESTTYHTGGHGKKTSHTNELGLTTTWQYNPQGDLTQQTEAQGTPEERTTTYAYDTHGQLTKHQIGTGPDAITTTYTYDDHGNLTSITDPEGHTTTVTYDAIGNPTSITDPLGRKTTTTYNARGQTTARTTPLGHTTTTEYDQRGQPIQITNPLGHTAQTTYDREGRIHNRTDPEGHTTTYEYNAYSDLIKITSPEGNQTTYTYDEQGRRKTQTDPNGNTISDEYGAYGTPNADLLVSLTFPNGQKEIYQYDQRSRGTVQTQQTADGKERKTITVYDVTGRKVARISPAGKTTQTEYDALDRGIKTTDPDNNTTLYQYDHRNNLNKMQDANGNVHRFYYDKLSHLTEETRPEGGKTVYDYNEAGQLTRRTNPDGDITVYTYNDDGYTKTQTQTSHSGTPELGQTITYTYNNAGQLTGYEQHNGTGALISKAAYTLDTFGRNTQETLTYGQGVNQINVTLGQRWNKDGQKISQTYPDGSTASFTYDKNHLKDTSLPGNSDKITWNSYDWLQPTEIHYPGATRTSTYDGFHRPASIKVHTSSKQNILNLAYQYDPDNNITRIDRQLGNTTTLTGHTLYTYDQLNRLTTVAPSQTLIAQGLPEEHYSYDAVHNRTSSAHQPGTWQYDTGNRLTQWGMDNTQITYAYTDAGHIHTETGINHSKTFQYNAAERLISVAENETIIADYQYDPFGRRISKTTGTAPSQNTTWFIYTQEGLLAEINPNGQQTKTYGWEPDSDWGTRLLWQAEHTPSPQTTTYHYIHNDHLGTPQVATDHTGKQTWAMISEAFGKTTPIDQQITMNLRFPGQYWDEETQTHYNYYRDYNPALGRYMQRDPLGLKAGLNEYVYVQENPLSRIDPYGLRARVCCREIEAISIFTSWITRPYHCFIHEEKDKDPCENCESLNRTLGLHGLGFSNARKDGTGTKLINAPFDRPEFSDCGGWKKDCELSKCLTDQFDAYPDPSFYEPTMGPNSNTFAYTLASRCGITDIPNVRYCRQ